MANTKKKGAGLHITTGAVTIGMTILGAVLFFLSFSTNYYIFGQMNSIVITGLLIGALVAAVLNIVLVHLFPEALWSKLLTFLVTGLLAAAAMLIVGDRVEGIGNCIVTDYDSGHGGEEAIYMSLVGAAVLLVGMIYNIIGAFHKNATAPASMGKTLGFSVSGGVIAVAAISATLLLTGVIPIGGQMGPGGNAAGTNGTTGQMLSGTFTVSFNGNNGNVDGVKDFEFVPATTKGLLNADTRLFLDFTLTLDGAGNYTLLADSYCVEGGKRAVIGDDTGLGLVLTTTAEGTYVDNGDGTVTTSPATHAVAVMETDTYSSQMRSPAKMKVGDHEEDGTYDSNDYPEVLNLVPETVWTLSGSDIVSYGRSALKGEFTVSFNGNSGNVDNVGEYEFIPARIKGLLNADTRLFLDMKLNLDGAGEYTLFAEGYVIENGQRAVIGDDTGLGLVLTTTAEGTYVDNGDGTVTTSPATHAVAVMETDTYSSQMRSPAKMKVGEHEEDGTYDSNDYPEVLDLVPETIWTLSGSEIVTYESTEEEQPDDNQPEDNQPEDTQPAAEGVVITSDDGGTTLTFNSDGTFAFDFAAYSIHEEGTYTYEGGVLTVTNANGVEATAEGDPMALHYVSATSEQLTGDYTIPASTFDFPAAGGEVQSVEITSDDGGTTLTFNSDGTYAFDFASYSIHEEGTYTYDGGVLTVINANGVEATAEGDPMALHYVSATSEQLTGDYTIPASTFDFPAAGGEVQSVEITSDDGGTTLTFNSDGTYAFDFAAYSIHEEGTYTYAGGVLTVTNANGVEATAEGDPMALHYVSATSEQLTGDYTIPASTFDFPAAGSEVQSVEITSDDGGTTLTFNSDGTYAFDFAAYSIHEEGTYSYAGGVLTVTNANGVEATAEGDPMALHYVSATSEQLTGDYTIPASTFDFGGGGRVSP